uniref:Nucleosome assembly protein n=1 Tax=Strombidium inclinatum TaxID=197538 RepID=A0A7S3IJH0_9SPIT
MIKTILAMPKEVQDRFKVLHMLSDKRSKLNDEFNEACKKLEAQIMEKKKPFLEQRRQIISGDKTDFGNLIPRFEETHKELEKKVAGIVKADDEKEEEDKAEEKTPTDVSYLKGQQGIPDFWQRSMKSNRLIWDQVREKDEEIMKHLRHVETTSAEDEVSKNMTVTLKMEFDEENEFFTPSTLFVTLEYESQDQVKDIKGTAIEWKEGKDPTKKKIKKKQKHKKTGETRTVVKTVDADSFFNIFQDRTLPKEGENDSDAENEVQDKIDEVQQTVEDFHDLLVPDALEYFLNFNEDFDMLGLDGEGDESGDDDDDDDEDESANKKPAGGKKGGAAEAGGDQQQECKQQ